MKLCIANPRESEEYGWYLEVLNGEWGTFLHSDIKIRLSTRNQDTNKYTGYFATAKEAFLVKELWEFQNANTN